MLLNYIAEIQYVYMHMYYQVDGGPLVKQLRLKGCPTKICFNNDNKSETGSALTFQRGNNILNAMEQTME